jgi:predicted metal-dependent hydrolase
VKDERLVAALDKFTAQEGQHYRQHALFNQTFRGRGYDGLGPLEDELEADYQRFTKTKSLRFNLAYAEGFEAFTSQLAIAGAERDAKGWHPAAQALFGWHLLEELEHRTVAFDVYQHVFGGYPYRVAVSLFAQRHLIRFVDHATTYMLERDREVIAAKYGGASGRAARMRVLRRQFLGDLLPRVARTYSPWYTPHAIEMPARMSELAARIAENRDSLPL